MARWCIGYKVETIEGAFRVREDEPACHRAADRSMTPCFCARARRRTRAASRRNRWNGRAGGTLAGGPIGAVDRTGDGVAELLIALAGPPSSQLRVEDAFTQAVISTTFVFPGPNGPTSPGFKGDIFPG